MILDKFFAVSLDKPAKASDFCIKFFDARFQFCDFIFHFAVSINAYKQENDSPAEQNSFHNIPNDFGVQFFNSCLFGVYFCNEFISSTFGADAGVSAVSRAVFAHAFSALSASGDCFNVGVNKTSHNALQIKFYYIHYNSVLELCQY